MTDYEKKDYYKRKQNQLRNAYKMIDDAANEIKKGNTEFFKDYLNVQSLFSMYTSRNALLIAKQDPNVKMLKNYKKWQEEKIVFKARYPKKITILEPGKSYYDRENVKVTPYQVKEVIDISQTTAQLKEQPFDKRIILQSLIKNSPATVKVMDKFEDNNLCKWDKDNNTLFIAKSENIDSIIKSVVKEIAKINYFNETQLISEERAEMICYMFCHKYKIENSLENSDKIIGIFKEDEIVDIKNDLSTIKDIYDQITIQMDQYLEMDRRERKDNERNER